MLHRAIRIAVWVVCLLSGIAFAQFPSFPGAGPLVPLPPPGTPFPLLVPPPYPPPPPPPQIGIHPVFGPWCAGPIGPGPCADVHRFLLVQHVANYIQVPFYGMYGTMPICNGPLGPGPCRDIQVFLAVRQLAQEQIHVPQWHGGSLCLGPMGPAPCDVVRDYLMLVQSSIGLVPQELNLRKPHVVTEEGPHGEAMCQGPAKVVPCIMLAQMGLDRLGGTPPPMSPIGIPPGEPQKVAHACAKKAGLDVGAFSACAGGRIILTQRQQQVLDCAVAAKNTQMFASCAAERFGIGLSDEQKRLATCAIRAKGVEDAFRSCRGSDYLARALSEDERTILSCAAKFQDVAKFGECASTRFMRRTEKAIVECALKSDSANDFAACAAPNVGVKMSNEQRVLAKCALQSKGNEASFTSCSSVALLENALGPENAKVLDCAANAAGDTAKFAMCSANSVFGERLSNEQRIAVQCAAQSQGDPTGFATCAGANFLGMQLNPEQQIAVQCVVSTGGAPPAAAGCIASRLVARELTKCLTDGVGGKGCFGDNNDLVGKNGFVGRTLSQIAGGPNSLINKPDQVWGGDNSFVRNPGQIWGGPNSFVQNPSQIWGGPNSVFNNPSQILPTAKPVQIGSVAGKRICLPWC